MTASGAEPVLCPHLGFDPLDPIWSCSAALFVMTADGSSAVSVRLCSYPTAGTAWVWAHVVTPQGSWGHNLDHAAGPTDRIDVEGDDTTYPAAAGGVVLRRRGRRADPDGAEIDITVAAHAGLAAPDADGRHRLRLRGSFTPAAAAGGTLSGRSEVLGSSSVDVEVDGDRVATVVGAAQWHEQHQDDARFVVPFTYASLRGPDLALVALVAPRASGGFTRGADGDRRLVAARLAEPAGGEHGIDLDVADGPTLHGTATVHHDLTIPIYGRPWNGTLVTATIDGHAVTGSVNRWRHRLRA